MDVLQDLIKRLTSIPTTDFVREIVEENKPYLEDKNTEQLNAGMSSDGSNIYPPYSPFTKAIKAAKGQPFDRVTLKDEGDFHSSIKAQAEANGFTMKATDWKAEGLQIVYGEEILGLSEDSIAEFKEDIVRPEMIDKTRNHVLRKWIT